RRGGPGGDHGLRGAADTGGRPGRSDFAQPVAIRDHHCRHAGAGDAAGAVAGTQDDRRGGRAMSGPDVLGSLLVLGMGAGVVAVAWRGWQAGELLARRGLCGGGRLTRERNPLACAFFFALYVCGGTAAAVWGLLALLGAVPPPQW